MRNRYDSIILTCILLLIVVVMAGCKTASQVPAVSTKVATATTISKTEMPTSTKAQVTPRPTSLRPTKTISETQTPSTGGVSYPGPNATTPVEYTSTPESTTQVSNLPETSPTQEVASATPTTQLNSIYPGPQSPEPNTGEDLTQLYPGPQNTSTSTNNQAQATSTPKPTQTPSRSKTPTSQLVGTGSPSPTSAVTFAPSQATPTEMPPKRPISPPPVGSNITIWYSWSSKETEVLNSIIQSFQKAFPDLTFDLTYVPMDDLFGNFQEAVYLGQGPDLLLGPAQWGPELFNEQLIADLKSYIPTDYLSTINPAALASGMYNKSLISLPLSQRGVVMFRNTSIITSAPETFDELIDQSRKATRAGIVGSYLERGAYFSSAGIIGLGGGLMDNTGKPAFNSQAGLDWINLLQAYDEAGAVTFNTNWDLDRFDKDKVGIIIDGTWNLPVLTAALGSDELAIDPWPTYGSGHLSGWVEADSIFLSANTTGNDRTAALAFMGYLLDPNVQMRLAEVGHIPSVMTTEPRDPLIRQAMEALSDGVPFPITVNESVLELYWKALNTALQDIFVNQISPANALKSASLNITQGIINLQATP